MSDVLAIIGRPNVGKSTLFNRLIGKRLALVANEPGITRDYRIETLEIDKISYDLIDTAGIEDLSADNISRITKLSSIKAIDKANILLFVIDARSNLTSDDISLSSLIRKSGKKVILIANKCEGVSLKQGEIDSLSFGFGDPVLISSEHNLGIDDLLHSIKEVSDHNSFEKKDFDDHKKITILGRPNSGKSTLINQLVGEERQIVGPEAGLTRDSVPIFFQWKSLKYQIWDTAGIRKKSKVIEHAEKLSVMSSLNATENSQIAILMVDALRGFEKQDANISNLIEHGGKPFLIAINKWDMVTNKKILRNQIEEQIEEFLPQLGQLRVCYISAQNGKGIDRMMDALEEISLISEKRLGTSQLNNFLNNVVSKHPHPNKNGRQVKIKYMTQIGSKPPSFVIFTNHPDFIKESYKRYLINEIRKEFEFEGITIRLDVKGSSNPYSK